MTFIFDLHEFHFARSSQKNKNPVKWGLPVLTFSKTVYNSSNLFIVFFCSTSIIELNQKLHDLCKTAKYARFSTYLDVHTTFDKNRFLIKPDGRHQNWTGSMALAKMIQKHMIKVGMGKVVAKGNQKINCVIFNIHIYAFFHILTYIHILLNTINSTCSNN